MTYPPCLKLEHFTPRHDESLFEFWASLTPAAPFLGIRWRFADDTPPAEIPPRASKTAEVATPGIAKPAAGVKPAHVVEAVEPVLDGVARPAGLHAAPPPKVDDLKLIKGIGPTLEQMLNAMGIYTFDQIASFNKDNLAWVDSRLTAFKGRPLRDDWVGQALELKK